MLIWYIFFNAIYVSWLEIGLYILFKKLNSVVISFRETLF